MSFESNNFEPNIILCVFPNLEKILFLSSESSDKNLFTIKSKFIFDDEFFDSIENKFSKTLRSGNLSLLGPNGVPEKIENILRDETIETIIDSVNQKLELNSDINQDNISIFFFSGQVLNFDDDELENALKSIFTDEIDNTLLNEMTILLLDLINDEKELINKNKNSELYNIITGNQGEYATIWDKDSI
ncbi:MAG: hypothetical protein ACJ0HA_02790 [Dehalococcoidia bacterium]|tara:strand:+ start:797 stop:1363 length:567 start_codon:yes stop_codon:yes gene_type:complete